MKIRLGNVFLNEKTEELVLQVLREGKIGQSEMVQEFERRFAEFLGVKYAIATANGTMADTIALAVLKSKFPGKTKVAVPALTFIAQINSVYYNHLEPVFYDVGKEPYVDEETLCVFPVHLLGKPVKIPTGVPVIEDACEALGSKLNGKYCGTMGDMGTFSFFPSHTITTGEGGMIVTDNDEYAEVARKLRNHGKNKSDDFKFDVIGFNGKMGSLQAAIGVSLMDTLQEQIEKRHNNYILMGGKEGPDEYIVPHGFPMFYESRDEKMEELKEAGIECRRLFSSIPTQEKAYEFLGYYKLGDFPEAERIGDTGLYVPCHQGLALDEIDYIRRRL